MQIKKSREVELERKKPTLFLLGLAVACAFVLSAFEWRTPIEENTFAGTMDDEISVFEVEDIPNSFRSEEKIIKNKPDVQKEVTKAVIDAFTFDDEKIPMDDFEFPDIEEEPIVYDITPVSEENVDEEPLIFADVMPEFPGGEAARRAFLKGNLNFPQMAKDAGISGKVYIGFVVAKDGSIQDIEVLRGVGGGLDEEALKVVKAMPKWNPGFNNGRPVNVRFVMPISFTLRN
jgi:protein TonB